MIIINIDIYIIYQGWPFVMFGNGEICKCNPIAESDLAAYMLDCVEQENKWNKVLNIGIMYLNTIYINKLLHLYIL